MLPTAIAKRLEEHFAGQAITSIRPTFGGVSNMSLALRIGTTPCVLKAAEQPGKRNDLRHEATILGLLAGKRLGAPTTLALLDDDAWSILVMRRRPGLPGLRFVTRPAADLIPIYQALGHTLARLHQQTPADSQIPPTEGLAIHVQIGNLAPRLAELPLPDMLTRNLIAAIAHPVWQPTAPRLIHGDAGLHNILWGARGLSLLDWEWAGWGDPRLDLAWVDWTIRFRQLPRVLWEVFLERYIMTRRESPDLEPATHNALIMGQITALLVRSAGQAAAWEEWVRRASWTLAQGEMEP
ncbi:phosphotransferase [Candidatus Chloroploca sp. M-50]|uniref:Phosphotransferase n=1 Tax=Candidatus Chloroploca mongolica TaxID=2528176 RepID=A0ABS4D8V0_9CHLR|nr:phosphotransferase [Candidatus Chloroploca mongolica]MBP1465869.1 phosphotransferase [Candidatus Chloroploca mongolica]